MSRASTIRRASGRTMRSTYRCRTRASSLIGLCATGSGRSAFAVSRHSLDQHGQLAAAGGDDLAGDEHVVAEVDVGLPGGQRLRADPVQRDHGLQLGAGRAALTQGGEAELAGVAHEDDPAGDADLVAGRACPAAGRGGARRTSASVAVRGTVTGYGSAPAALSRSSFSRRTSSCSESPARRRSRPGSFPRRAPGHGRRAYRPNLAGSWVALGSLRTWRPTGRADRLDRRGDRGAVRPRPPGYPPEAVEFALAAAAGPAGPAGAGPRRRHRQADPAAVRGRASTTSRSSPRPAMLKVLKHTVSRAAGAGRQRRGAAAAGRRGRPGRGRAGVPLVRPGPGAAGAGPGAAARRPAGAVLQRPGRRRWPGYGRWPG